MRYERVRRRSKEQLHSDLQSANPELAAEALYSAARFEGDFEWVENLLLEKITSADVQVRWAAATCLGDLAFQRCQLDLERVVPALEAAILDPEISEPASFSLIMVKQFLGQKL